MKIRNLLRARRIRKLRSRLDAEEHIKWAQSLVLPRAPRPGTSKHNAEYPRLDQAVVIHDTDIQPDGLDVGPWHSNYDRFANSGHWSYDPVDGFPYPPV